MKTILNNFIHVLKRFKTSSILNLLGLSAAIFIFFVIAIQVHYDLTFNSNFKDVENLYRIAKLETTAVDQTYIRYMTIDEVNILTNKFPEIENVCLTAEGEHKSFVFKILPNEEKIEFNEYSTTVTNSFNEMFAPKILEGNIEQAINLEGNVIVSKQTALRIFGEESPINKVVEIFTFVIDVQESEGGRSINITTQPKTFTIKAVYEDFPGNCSINNGFIIFREAQRYYSYRILAKVNKNHEQQLLEKINTAEILDQMSFGIFKATANHNVNIEKTNTIKLAPLKNIHLNYPDLSSKAQEKKSLVFMISVGLFALIIAYINFVNFTIAMAPARIRAINIRMVLGANKASIRLILASEALLFTLSAILIALFILTLFQNSEITQMFAANMTIGANLPLLVSVMIVLLIFSFVVGIYPAYYITTFDPVVAIKSTSANNISTSKLRNLLVVIQLIAAITFITIALFIKIQHNYLTSYSLGFDKENIIVLPIKDQNTLNTDIKTFVSEIMQNPIISDYTSSRELIGIAGGSHMVMEQDSMMFAYNSLEVQDNFLTFFNIPIVEGESLNKNIADERSKSVVNEQFIKRHNIKDGLAGLQKKPYTRRKVIVGIANDFHYTSLLGEVGALELTEVDINQSDNNESKYLYFKSPSNDIGKTRKYIGDVWRKFSTENLDIKFLDENLNQLYKAQEDLATIISIVSIIIILIAIMGVYGLTSFNTKYKTKELAIRRVNGAEVSGILLLLNKSLLIQFAIAFVISVPIVYFAMDLWLQQFPYRIDIDWWIFALGGLLILLITIVTVSVQSYRAATANPIQSLKSE